MEDPRHNTRTKYAKYTYTQYKTRIHTRGKVDEGRGIKRKKLYKKKKKRIYKKVEQNKETHNNNLFFRPSKSDSINVKIKTKKKK